MLKKSKILVVITLGLLLVSVVGCYFIGPKVPKEAVRIPSIPSSLSPVPSTEVVGIPNELINAENSAYQKFVNSQGVLGLFPSTVWITGIYPGDTADGILAIRNSLGSTTDVVLQYAVPAPGGDYTPATLLEESWVSYPKESITLKDGDITVLLLNLSIPVGASVPGKEWWFKMDVLTSSPGDMVAFGPAQRWVVLMK